MLHTIPLLLALLQTPSDVRIVPAGSPEAIELLKNVRPETIYFVGWPPYDMPIVAGDEQTGATGPTIVWRPGPTGFVNITTWQICVDTSSCLDVGPEPNRDVNGAGTFAWRLAAPLSTTQPHSFVVKACNAVACTPSAPMTIGPPEAPTIVTVK